MNDKEYSKFVWDNADSTDMYEDILDDLLKDNPYLKKVNKAKDKDDFATIEIGTNFIGKYIVQLANDVISHIGQKEGWEASEDKYRQDIGLGKLKRFTKKYETGNSK